MLEILCDNKEQRCYYEHTVLVIDSETKEAFKYSIINCTSGGGGWVTTWDNLPTERNMEVLGFLYNEWKERNW